MMDARKQQGLFRRLWLATAVVLILLLLAGSASHHSVSQLCFLLVPVFLFAAVVVQERCFVEEADALACGISLAPSLFQRPPPSLI